MIKMPALHGVEHCRLGVGCLSDLIRHIGPCDNAQFPSRKSNRSVDRPETISATRSPRISATVRTQIIHGSDLTIEWGLKIHRIMTHFSICST